MLKDICHKGEVWMHVTSNEYISRYSSTYLHIRHHGSDVNLGMSLIHKHPQSCWNGGLFQDVTCDNVLKGNLDCAYGNSVVGCCYLVPSFILIILPTVFLRSSSAWHRTCMELNHTRGRAEISEPQGNKRQWHSDLYSIWGNTKFVSPMYKHTPMPPFCYRTVYIHVLAREASRILQIVGTFFYVVHTQNLVVKPSIAS